MTAIGIVGLAVWNGMRLGEVVYPGTSATVPCLIGVVLVLSQTGEQGHVSKWLTWQPLVALGQISYGVYVWQQLFLGPPAPGFENVRTFPLGLLATIAVAVASYWYLEKPFLKLKDLYFHTSFGRGKAATPRPMLQPTAANALVIGRSLADGPVPVVDRWGD